MPRHILYRGLFVAWAALTFTLTSIPNPRFPAGLETSDKAAHAVAYGGMGFLCALWRRERGDPAGRALFSALAFVLVAGAADEIHQRFIPGRSMDLHDWIADAAGGGAGSVASVLLHASVPWLRGRGAEAGGTGTP
jgi:VanZ family protein